MKDYTDLFYFKREKERLENTINDIGSIRGKLVFYENELSVSELDKAFQHLYKLRQELEKEVEKEKEKFTREELKELHFIYKEKYGL